MNVFCSYSPKVERKKGEKKDEKKKTKQVERTDSFPGAEAFFAGAKDEPKYEKRKTDRKRKSRDREERETGNDENLYENFEVVKEVEKNRSTVAAEIHRENSRLKHKRKPAKVPRKIARPPSSTLQPIYENQRSIESQRANTD